MTFFGVIQLFRSHKMPKIWTSPLVRTCSILVTFVSSFWRGIQQSVLVTEMMIQKNVKGLERMKVLITSHITVFLGNKYNSYIHTAQNA